MPIRLTQRILLPTLLAALTLATAPLPAQQAAKLPVFDVVVYGGTAGGVAAAVQAARMGKSALVIEPTGHLGGLTSGGLGATDIGNKGAIGGISREFYVRVKKYYENDAVWKQQKRDQYRSGRGSDVDEAMWTFEPHVAETILNDFIRESGVQVVYKERLDRQKPLTLNNGKIDVVTMESGKQYRGKMYIDATYEGDLLALAGVSYTVGREGNSQYNETLNGVQVRNATKHQMHPGVDPYVKKGDKSSGLLPGVHAGPPGEDGSADKRVQAYNFRMCLTDAADNRIPFVKPEGYDPLRYELLLRNFEAGENRVPWSPTGMPNRKTDTNNNFGFSTDNIGLNYDFAEADYATRDKIFAEHIHYQMGLMWTLANDPRVPEKIRNEVARWGNCKDEFTATGGWSHQMYVREARRMVSDYVMTQHNCQGRQVVEDAVGLAAYTMDSHNVQRYVNEKGHAVNEGDVQVGGFAPYPIAYRSLVPKRGQAANLFAPICLSATHIAYGSIRMEPVFMVLGQSSATAACQAIDANVAVQDVDVKALQAKLLADKQVLAWTGARPNNAASIDPKKLPGVVVDDNDAQAQGDWVRSSSIGGFVGNGYAHDNKEGAGQKKLKFSAKLPSVGKYEVRFAYTPQENRATNVKLVVVHANGQQEVVVNERKAPSIDKTFVSLGSFTFNEGGVVEVLTAGADGYVVADAVQFLPAKP